MKKESGSKIKTYLRPFLSWKFLVSFGAAWIITNGWAYVVLFIGTKLGIGWMIAVGGGYLSMLWLPISPEKIITIPMAIWIHTKMFKNDDKTRALLIEMYGQAQEDFKALKLKLKRNKKKVEVRDNGKQS